MAPRTILLVDPDRDSLTIFSLILEHHGYRVVSARTPEEGLRLARAERPDLVVAELFLAPVEGHPLADRLRQEPWTVGVPIVGLSTQSPRHPRPGSASCDSHLAKPCIPTRLVAEVARLIGTSA